jgi:2-phospho-L-lactate guanylyltransferase
MLGDLPALRPADLADALRRAAAFERTVVADAEGTGSTLVTARADVPWAAAFGDGSLARHLALGAVSLDAAPSLRRDVDTPDQLAEASRLGLGVRSAPLARPRYPGEGLTPAEERDSTR